MTITQNDQKSPNAPTHLDAQAVFDAMAAGWNAADPIAIGATYAPEGRLVNPFGEQWTGREDVVSGFTDYFNGMLAGTTTAIRIDQVRELQPGLTFVDGTQTFTGGLPTMHLTAVVRSAGDAALVVECRPYVLMELPA